MWLINENILLWKPCNMSYFLGMVFDHIFNWYRAIHSLIKKTEGIVFHNQFKKKEKWKDSGRLLAWGRLTYSINPLNLSVFKGPLGHRFPLHLNWGYIRLILKRVFNCTIFTWTVLFVYTSVILYGQFFLWYSIW